MPWMFCLVVVMIPTFFKLGATTVMVGVLQSLLGVAALVAAGATATALWLSLRQRKPS